MNETETHRLAAAINALRPDWPVSSLKSFITIKLSGRAYMDAALALTYVAADPASKTPARVLESGPWWSTNPNSSQTPRGERHVRKPRTESTLAAYYAQQARDAFEANRLKQCVCGVLRENCVEHREVPPTSQGQDEPHEEAATEQDDPDHRVDVGSEV